MSLSDWRDFISGAAFALSLVLASVCEMRVRHHKRFARTMENRVIDARERASTAEHALGLLRRALARMERDDQKRDGP